MHRCLLGLALYIQVVFYLLHHNLVFRINQNSFWSTQVIIARKSKSIHYFHSAVFKPLHTIHFSSKIHFQSCFVTLSWLFSKSKNPFSLWNSSNQSKSSFKSAFNCSCSPALAKQATSRLFSGKSRKISCAYL